MMQTTAAYISMYIAGLLRTASSPLSTFMFWHYIRLAAFFGHNLSDKPYLSNSLFVKCLFMLLLFRFLWILIRFSTTVSTFSFRIFFSHDNGATIFSRFGNISRSKRQHLRNLLFLSRSLAIFLSKKYLLNF